MTLPIFAGSDQPVAGLRTTVLRRRIRASESVERLLMELAFGPSHQLPIRIPITKFAEGSAHG